MGRTRRGALVTAAVCVAVVLASCGGGDASSGAGPVSTTSYGPAATGPHNEADVELASGMIPHHAQAVAMADIALETSAHPKVEQIAHAIRGAQAPEIRTMGGWLIGWGEKVPDVSMSSMHGMGHSSGSGMLTETQLNELDDASGAAFDRMFCEMMIEHHEGAIAMARAALADGQNPEAKVLAQEIVEAQTAEITTLRGLLGTLPR